MIEKGTWVEIEKIILLPQERSNNLPEDTKETPLMMWVKGFCLANCEIGQEIEVETITGRVEKGIVTRVEPNYTHSFGKYIGELAYIGLQAREILFGDK